MHVVVYGNPFDGLTIVGPFEDADEANAWADNNDGLRSTGQDWWVVEVEEK